MVMLAAGRMSVCGVTPNGQTFQAQPRRLWQVVETTAVIDGQDAEILAAVSPAIDLGLGQPMEHMLRSALLALRIADRVGLEALLANAFEGNGDTD